VVQTECAKHDHAQDDITIRNVVLHVPDVEVDCENFAGLFCVKAKGDFVDVVGGPAAAST
jgi:hypothetical protein